MSDGGSYVCSSDLALRQKAVISTAPGKFLRQFAIAAIRKQPQSRGPDHDILTQLRGIDLVERIVRRVMQVEIAGAILLQIDRRHAGMNPRADIGSTMRFAMPRPYSDGRQRQPDPLPATLRTVRPRNNYSTSPSRSAKTRLR